MNVKGTWSTRAAVLPTAGQSRPASLFPVLNKKIDSIASVFRAAYANLKGTDAYWYPSLDEGTLYKNGPWCYAYRSAFMYYYYNKAYKKIIKTGEIGTWAYAFVNRLFWLFDETQMSIEANGQKRLYGGKLLTGLLRSCSTCSRSGRSGKKKNKLRTRPSTMKQAGKSKIYFGIKS